MKAFNGFLTGFNSFFKAIPFIFKNKLSWIFFIPLLLYIIIYASGFAFMDYLGNISSPYIDQLFEGESSSEFMQKLPGILIWLVKFLIHVLFFFVFVYFGGFIILIVLSPLFAWLSEQTDQIINNTNYPFSWAQFFNDIWRGILIALRNMFYELGITILVIIATLLPFINIISGPIAALLLFFVSSYFYGFSFMDYTNERKRIKMKDTVLLMKNYRGMAIANGMLFSFSLFIPLLGGFVAIVATVGATLAMNEIPEIKNYNSQITKNK